MTLAEPLTIARLRLHVSGVVQGVGFRPFVYGLAEAWQLAGFVGNNSAGVFIEVEGPARALAQFEAALRREPPPLAVIEAITSETLPVRGEAGFRIVASEAAAATLTLISPDVAVCEACLREMRDPHNRRYRYPFINCTHCGPRFTIIRALPYDRPLTTMAAFTMCPACAAEYQDPRNRRFHAQPNACPVCGPRLWLEAEAAERMEGEAALTEVRRRLADGQIVAVKGVGGFHLACAADSEAAVQRLRERKGRPAKPFALMVADLAAAQALVALDDAAAELLTSPARPIVLARHRPTAALARWVAPGNAALGVMLPYSPVHHLLLEASGPLVMTSGNLSDEPIAKDNAEARRRLAGLADAFLMHDRDIHIQCDDSVVRAAAPPVPVRRSRGYAPFPVALPFAVPPLLAVGGELKATFCLARGRHAFMSQHLGDLENLETLRVFEAAADHLQRVLACAPEVIVSDLHPRYLASRWAAEHAAGRRHVRVQHHHAHVAAVMAENGHPPGTPVLGFAFDGTGYGPDGAIWGGEVLVADYAGYERVSHLAYVPLAGGDAAVRRPYRVALAHLRAAGLAWEGDLPPVQACSDAEQAVLAHQLSTGLNSVPTSSMGRLFDAVASLLNLRQTATYEAQPAIELEGMAGAWPFGGADEVAYAFDLRAGVFDAAPVWRALVMDLRAGLPAALLAARFQASVAVLILALSRRLRAARGLNVVALSGGVFQNTALTTAATRLLQADGFHTLTHSRVPPNDGGLALGQAVVGGFEAR